jgi:hypothetical protein
MKRTVRSLVVFVLWIHLFAAGLFAVKEDDPIVGTWAWVRGRTVTFHADGTYKQDPNGGGKWECTSESPRKYVLKWDNGKLVDRLTLGMRDGHLKLDGTNNIGGHIAVTKMGDTPEEEANGMPSRQLAPYIEHIVGLLALNRPEGPRITPLFNRASGRVGILKGQYQARRAEASGKDAQSLAAAVATCDALLAALDERQKTRGQIERNSAVPGSTLGRSEDQRERALALDNSFTKAANQRWNERSIQLRQQITTLYGKIIQ